MSDIGGFVTIMMLIFGALCSFFTFEMLENLLVARLYKIKPKVIRTLTGEYDEEAANTKIHST